MKFVNNIKESFASTAVADAHNDRADLVQTVLLVAGFAIAALVLVNWLSTAILNQGANAAACIEGANNYTKSSAQTSADKCVKGDAKAKANGYAKDKTYTDRYQ